MQCTLAKLAQHLVKKSLASASACANKKHTHALRVLISASGHEKWRTVSLSDPTCTVVKCTCALRILEAVDCHRVALSGALRAAKTCSSPNTGYGYIGQLSRLHADQEALLSEHDRSSTELQVLLLSFPVTSVGRRTHNQSRPARSHPVHASDTAQAHALLTCWQADNQGKVGSTCRLLLREPLTMEFTQVAQCYLGPGQLRPLCGLLQVYRRRQGSNNWIIP